MGAAAAGDIAALRSAAINVYKVDRLRVREGKRVLKA